MNNIGYKALSIKEFAKAANIYEGDTSGIYEMCKKDYPDSLTELEKKEFHDLLAAGLKVESFEIRKGIRLHRVIRKQALHQNGDFYG